MKCPNCKHDMSEHTQGGCNHLNEIVVVSILAFTVALTYGLTLALESVLTHTTIDIIIVAVTFMISITITMVVLDASVNFVSCYCERTPRPKVKRK